MTSLKQTVFAEVGRNFDFQEMSVTNPVAFDKNTDKMISTSTTFGTVQMKFYLHCTDVFILFAWLNL